MASQTLSDIGGMMLEPLVSLWNGFVVLMPQLIAAVVVLVAGFLIATLLAKGVRSALNSMKLAERTKEGNLMRKVGYSHLPNIFGEIVKWYVFIIFLQVSVRILDVGVLNEILGQFVGWLPNVIAGILIVMFGLGTAHYIELKMIENSKMKGISFLAQALKYIIIVMVVIVALTQIGIETSVLENTFLILVAGLSLGLALAIGLGFGLGFNDGFTKLVGALKKKKKKRK